MELPGEDGFLPLLDTQIKIREDGSTERRLYSKAASKDITLHFRSHHASSTKKAMVSNEIQRAITASTADNKDKALEKTRNKLVNNGYPVEWCRDRNLATIKKKPPPTPTCTRLTMKIPFVSDSFNQKVTGLLRKHNIPAKLVNERGRSLKEIVKPKRQSKTTCKCKDCPAKGFCQKSNVVYAATCSICQDMYIGMTTRLLHERAREHLAAARNHSASSAFGEHYRDTHPKMKPEIMFSIITRTHGSNSLYLHIEEAMAIQKLKPALNRRLENTGTGFLP